MKIALSLICLITTVGCTGPKFRNVGIHVPREEYEAYAAAHGITYEQARQEMPIQQPKLLEEQAK